MEIALLREASPQPRGWRLRADYRQARRAIRIRQCAWLREIFGDPFRHASVAPDWLTWQGGTVVKLARAAYEDQSLPAGTLANDRLAVLADALEEAGCMDGQILGHLRGGGEHYRGCFAIDLLLGKS
jgi:hypothetical protein